MTALELSGPPEGLLDDPPALRVRGGGGARDLIWRGRIRDDDGRVWRAIADDQAALHGAWVPGKSSTGALMALTSLRPVELEVRVEAPDGRAATRTLKRLLVGDGVRVRRWRGDVPAVLHLPAGTGPFPSTVLDATSPAEDGEAAAVATLAAPLLASRGILALVVGPPAGRVDRAELLDAALRTLGDVPSAAPDARTLTVLDSQADGAGHEVGSVVVTPPGVGVRGSGAGPDAALARAAAWDALLAAVGARPRAD